MSGYTWGETKNPMTRAEIGEENLWLESLLGVVVNDPDATQNWYIPLQLLDYVGFDIEELRELSESVSRRNEDRNMLINQQVEFWIEGRIAFNKERINTLTLQYGEGP